MQRNLIPLRTWRVVCLLDNYPVFLPLQGALLGRYRDTPFGNRFPVGRSVRLGACPALVHPGRDPPPLQIRDG